MPRRRSDDFGKRVRAFGLRRSRSIGLGKTHLQHIGIAVASVSLVSFLGWMESNVLPHVVQLSSDSMMPLRKFPNSVNFARDPVALEKPNEPQVVVAVKKLIEFHREGIITIVIGWSTMLEKPPKGEEPLWLPEQKRRLETLGLGDVEQFKHNQTMWFRNEEGYATYEPEYDYLCAVHGAMFPNIDFRFQDYLTRYCREHHLDLALYKAADYYSTPMTRHYTPPTEWKQRLAKEQEFPETSQTIQTLKKIREKWMNAKNDALGLCAHVSWHGDIFVTSDKHFHKAQVKAKLSLLVPGKILRPEDIVQEIEQRLL